MSEGPAIESAVLGGERIVLRPLDVCYARDAFELIHERETIVRWLVWEGPERLEDLEEHFRHWCVPSEQGDNYSFVILDRERQAVLGSISARFANHPGTGDIGYWLGEPYWGRGYMTEAIRLVDYFCFRCLAADVLCAWVFVGNDGSRTVLERNGFSLVRTARNEALKRGQAMDEWYFALLRNEWELREAGWRPETEDVQYRDR